MSPFDWANDSRIRASGKDELFIHICVVPVTCASASILYQAFERVMSSAFIRSGNEMECAFLISLLVPVFMSVGSIQYTSSREGSLRISFFVRPPRATKTFVFPYGKRIFVLSLAIHCAEI